MSWLRNTAVHGLARRGLALRRHPGARRQSLLAALEVDLVVDVGAARGGFAQEVRSFGYRGRIVSFEPLAEAFADLSVASAGDPAWQVRNRALGSSPGSAEINVASNSDSSSLLPMGDLHRAAAPQVDYVATQTITVARLDDELGDDVARRPFLKLDTQGFEREVLEGGPDTLSRAAGLQLELSFVPLYAGGMLVDEAVSFAYDHGFVLAALETGFSDPGGAVLQADGIFVRS
ncbi:MAG: FkbM family methyltransferase [Microbacterium sp.]|nr:MAG: FkbM family methyltransferase [Microbacterium sp.]